MKKVAEFCPQCKIETTHRRKRKSQFRSKKEGYKTYPLPLKCMTCGYLHGKRMIREGKRTVMISLR